VAASSRSNIDADDDPPSSTELDDDDELEDTVVNFRTEDFTSSELAFGFFEYFATANFPYAPPKAQSFKPSGPRITEGVNAPYVDSATV